jgi:uncharacterized protein with PQ loop repeat
MTMEHGQVLWLIGWAYVLVNTGRVLSYLPQIAAVWRCRDGAQSISLFTWGYWSISHLTAALYGGVVVSDGKLLAVSLGNLSCCLAVVVITSMRRRLSKPPSHSMSSDAARRHHSHTAPHQAALRHAQQETVRMHARP